MVGAANRTGYGSKTDIGSLKRNNNYRKKVSDAQIYIEENFDLGSAGNRLVNNILNYAAANIGTEAEQCKFFTDLLDGIGLTTEEIQQIFI